MIKEFEGLPFVPLIDSHAPSPPGAVVAFVVVRNEARRLPAFLRHYRALGVDRFYVVDNGSTNSTGDLLLGAPDVVPFHTADSYLDSGRGRLWTDALRERFGLGLWCLTLDADEFLAYPMSESCGVKSLAAYCDRQAYDGVFTILLDMYPSSAIADTHYEIGDDPVRVFSRFDADGYTVNAPQHFPPISVSGGVRQRVFGDKDADKRLLVLRKTPLIKWREGLRYFGSTHSHSPLRLADITGVLLHFKFMNDFNLFVQEELARGQRPAGADDYARYAAVAGADAELKLEGAASENYADTAQLVRLGLMKTSVRYLNDQLPHLRESLKVRGAAEVYSAQRQAMREAASRFRPDYRQILQLWDVIATAAAPGGVD